MTGGVEAVAVDSRAERFPGHVQRMVACPHDHLFRTVGGLVRHHISAVPLWCRLLMRNDLFTDGDQRSDRGLKGAVLGWAMGWCWARMVIGRRRSMPGRRIVIFGARDSSRHQVMTVP